jgi:hypothetical protein
MGSQGNWAYAMAHICTHQRVLKVECSFFVCEKASGKTGKLMGSDVDW